MAIGKGQKARGGKIGKGGKKKTSDPFSRKEWYDVKAPSTFAVRQVCKTLINRTQGTRIASEGLKGRVFESSLGDLSKQEDNGYMKFKLRVEDVQGKNCLTNFWGMNFTSDKFRSLIRKWHSMIEAITEVKTADGYLLRIFAVGFTAKMDGQLRKTSYAKSSQAHAIRKKMFDIIGEHVTKHDLKDFVKKLTLNTIGAEITKQARSVYPIQNTFIYKVKMIKAPKIDLTKLAELHADTKEDVGAAVSQ